MQQQQRPGQTFDEMAAWLLELERRLRVLEGENQDLRRQLIDLRRGVGISLVIEGRTVPVAPLSPITSLSGPMPVASPASSHLGHGKGGSATDTAAASDLPGRGYPSFGPLPTLPEVATAMARSWPEASRPAEQSSYSNPRVPAVPAQPAPLPNWSRGDQRPSWPPAATTAHMPVVRPLAPPPDTELRSESHAAWLRAGSEWPDQSDTRPAYPAPPSPATPPTPLAPLGQNPPVVPGNPLPLDQVQPERQPGERNPYADSFIL